MTHWLGIDLGGTNIKYVTLADHDGQLEVLTTGTIPTVAAEGPQAVVQRLVDIAQSAVAADSEIKGVGVTVPGLFDPVTGCTTLFPNLPGQWDGQPVVDPITRACGMPVSIINDARAFGLAEFWMGAAQDHQSMAGITIGTGLGGVVILDGRLHLSDSGAAGEIGHQTIEPNGPLCGCGNYGCLEVLASGVAIAENAGLDSAETVIDRARDGDARCNKVLADAASAIGTGLANLATVINPGVFVVGGGVSGGADVLIDLIQQALYLRAPLVDRAFLEVRPAVLGIFAGAVGAALWARR